MSEETQMPKLSVRLPNRVIDYFEEKSEETTIGKTTLMRSYLLEAVREKEGSDFSQNKKNEMNENEERRERRK